MELHAQLLCGQQNLLSLNQEGILRDRAKLSVRVSKTVTNHDRLEVDLGDGRSRDEVKSNIILVDNLKCAINLTILTER